MSSLKSRLIIFSIQHSHLMKGQLKREVITPATDINALRRGFIEGAKKFGSIPPNVLVSPVSIPRLANGLHAEWIHLAGSPAAPNAASKAIFYTHGGGYISGNCEDHRMHVAKFVRDTGIPALLYDYRLAPEHPAHAAVEDTLVAYRWLLEQGLNPGQVIIVGELAGGGLCLAALNAIRDSGLALPAAGVALSPWTDLTCSGNSYRTNALRDISTLGSWDVWGKFYVGPNDPCHPWISPLYGDLRGLPPVLIEVGDHEILLDDSRRYAEKAHAAGMQVTLRVWEGMVHCFPLLAPMFTEATQAWSEVIGYIQEKTG